MSKHKDVNSYDWQFHDLYAKKVRLDDSSNSGYEFAITCAALCWGLSSGHCLTLIREWWSDALCPDPHNHPYDERRFLRVILPAAVQASQPFIDNYLIKKAVEKYERDAKKTWPRIKTLLAELRPVTPTVLVRALNNQDGSKKVTLAAVKMQLKRHDEALCKENGTYRLACTPLSAGQTRAQEPQDVNITAKCYPKKKPVRTETRARVGRPRKMDEDLQWYADSLNVDLTREMLDATWNDLKSRLGSAPTPACYTRRLVADMEDGAGVHDAERLKDLLNEYLHKVAPAGRRIRIGILRAVTELRSIARTLGDAPDLSEIRTFLRNLAHSENAPFTVDEVVGRFLNRASRTARRSEASPPTAAA